MSFVTRLSSALLITVVTVSAAIAGDSEQLTPRGENGFVPAHERVFTTIMDGVAMSRVYGDYQTTAHGTFVRLDPGFRMPLHHYTKALTGIVISGHITVPIPGNSDSEQVLGPGSVFSFAANAPHETNNEGLDPAVFYIFQDFAWQAVMD